MPFPLPITPTLASTESEVANMLVFLDSSELVAAFLPVFDTNFCHVCWTATISASFAMSRFLDLIAFSFFFFLAFSWMERTRQR